MVQDLALLNAALCGCGVVLPFHQLALPTCCQGPESPGGGASRGCDLWGVQGRRGR